MSRVAAHARPTSLVLTVLALAACASTPPPPPPAANESSAVEAAIEEAYKPATPEQIAAAERSDPLTRATFWSREYQKDQANIETTIAFLRALRGIKSYDRIDDIGGRAMAIHPDSWELFMELGRAKTEQGNPNEAILLFIRAVDVAPLDEATPLAGLGLAFDRIEDHVQAQTAYEMALEREPGRVSTLSNYGLSLALSGELDTAETVLREATALPGADIRVRQNLALILGLQGKFEEMRTISPDAPERTVEANQRALKSMLGLEDGRKSTRDTVTDERAEQGAEPRLTLRPKLRSDSAS